MSDYQTKKPPVLVVEDDEVTREVIAELLKVLGYDDIRTAESGTQAVNFLEKDPRGFPIVIIDIFLTDMTAKHLASRVPRDHGIQKLLIISIGTADDFAAVRSVFEKQGIPKVHTAKKPVTREMLREFLE